MKKFFKEFKAFITRGNVFDMAIGLIIATAFNKIVSSMVNDILMPLVTYATGANSLKDLSITLKEAVNPATGLVEPTLTWAYGNFLQTVIDFLIIALSVFIMVKVVNGSRNRLKGLTELAKKESSKEVRAEKKAIKEKAMAENRPFKEVWKEHLAEKKAAEETKKAELEAEAKKKEEERLANTPEALLKDIRDLLAAKTKTDNTKKTK